MSNRRRLISALSLSVLLLVGGSIGGGLQVGASETDSADAFLRSIGADPTTAIRQNGLLNYAGPTCPGADWTCTTDTTKPVVQTAPAGGTNIFECSLDASECVVVQRGSEPDAIVVPLFTGAASAAGPNANVAKCNAADNPPNQPVQECVIDQTVTSGTNSASVTMKVNQNDTGAAVNQDASQTASVIQKNGTGPNLANISQLINQKAESNSSSASQSQDALQEVILQQENNSGDNSAQIFQSELQDAKAKGDTVTQSQNASPGIDVDTSSTQTSSSGKNSLALRQLTDQRQDVVATGNADQLQGAANGGQNAEVHQVSSGLSTYDADQDELQTQTGTAGTLTQTQLGPIDCCLVDDILGSQLGNTADTCSIDQNSMLSSGPDANQSTTAVTGFFTEGDCTANIHLETNDAEFNDTASGQAFFQVSNCTESECASGTPGEGDPDVPEFAGGATAAGTGLRNRDHGDITITGVPTGAVVTKAILFWGLLYQGSPPPGSIQLNGVPLVADTGQTEGILCWGDTNTVAYYKDVTSLVTGNGTYTVSNPPVPTRSPDNDPNGSLPYADGASLVVFFTGTGLDKQVLSDFSYNSNQMPGTGGFDGIHREFAGINSDGTEADIILAGPDGQNNGSETFVFTGSSTLTLNNTWEGSDPQIGPSFSIGNLWDTDTYDVSSVLPLGQTTLAFDNTTGSDCIGVGAAILTVNQPTVVD